MYLIGPGLGAAICRTLAGLLHDAARSGAAASDLSHAPPPFLAAADAHSFVHQVHHRDALDEHLGQGRSPEISASIARRTFSMSAKPRVFWRVTLFNNFYPMQRR